MDGRSRYAKLEGMIRNYEKGEKLSMTALRKLIMMNVGSSEKIIEESIKMLTELEMIREVENLIFEVQKDGIYDSNR